MNIYEWPSEKVFDTTIKDTKISLWTKFRLLFIKEKFSRDFITDNEESELWSETTYKVLNDKCYILKYKTYYVKRHSHFIKEKI